jgi:CcmD family protein
MWILLLQNQLPSANLSFLFAAFAVAWVGFFGYAFFVSRRRQEVQRELRALRREFPPQDTPEDG